MSRSAYVWLAFEGITPGGVPDAVFTVKHECADWIARREISEIAVCRMRDSHWHPEASPVWLDPVTLEPRIDHREEGRS